MRKRVYVVRFFENGVFTFEQRYHESELETVRRVAADARAMGLHVDIALI
jgi:hypothetical protein